MDKSSCTAILAVFRKIYEQKYSWLIGIITFITVAYITAGEFWRTLGARLNSGINLNWFIVYFIIFFSLTFIINVLSIRKLMDKHNLRAVIVVSLCSVLFDIVVISGVELITLLSTGALQQTQIQMQTQTYYMHILLLGALPASLGSITLSTTTESLRERNKQLHKELLAMKETIDHFKSRYDDTLSHKRPEWARTKETMERLKKAQQEGESFSNE
ncbi:MAG: hypothetical protein LBH62_04225 [Nitrososphaerota archaeon]|jgi:amino acid permease|nr:hypothetical protein [Nitrososphaerota archaeon]